MGKYLWREGHGSIPARMVIRRAVVRGVCLLVFFALVYHLLTSAALRLSIASVGHNVFPPAATDCAGDHCAPPPPPPQQQQQQQPEQPQQPAPLPSPVPAPKLDGTQSKAIVGKEKATLLMLVRNRELNKALSSMRMVEDRFNRNYKYPWTFMNDQPFTAEFIKYTSGLASGPVEYVQIPKGHWSIPPALNRSRIDQGMKSLHSQGVVYGGSLSYRHMCRFNSGFFYRQQALEKYDWYWRVEPDIELWCDIPYDPFAFMRQNSLVYGWVLSMFEFEATIPTLFDTTKEFVAKHPHHLAPDNSLAWVVDNANASRALADGKITGSYNLCHFWSNFEIASLDFFRSSAYDQYFQWLDSTGGFFYERWGDAPVHSLALSLFLPRSKIHHFSDFGYSHSPASRCPQDDASHLSGRCVCDRKLHNFDTDHQFSCGPRWFKLNGAGAGVKYPAD